MWDTFILNPMVNALLLLYDFLGSNFFLAIAIFTLIIRLLTLPLNLRQQRASMKMQQMQPQIQAIQKKYRDNPQKMQEEFQKLGYNPAESLMGCLPLLIQFPILIGLYRAITLTLGSTPQALFDLTQHVYPGIDLTALLPVANRFFWLNLAQPDPLFILPVLVMATTFLSQKAIMPPKPAQANDKKPQQEDPTAAMTQSMTYTMPLMFGMFSLQFPAGLSIYFILGNLIGIGQGWLMKRNSPPAVTTVPVTGQIVEESTEAESAKLLSENNGETKSVRSNQNRPPQPAAKKRPAKK